MDYLSTRGNTPPCTLDAALIAGLAPDGGLYVPSTLPQFTAADFQGASSLPRIATQLLAPFFAGSVLAPQLAQIAEESLDLPIVLHRLQDDLGVLELFHGPTAAFKDFAARFLATCMSRLRAADSPTTTILVATSGDTGAAVGAAFHGRPGFNVVILYPDGRVSPRQAHHLGAFGGNVRAYALRGNFDDCQALVKQAFADRELRHRMQLGSANSISLGRLLPQIAYYAWMALSFHRNGEPAPHLIIPSGNLGNGLAAILAQQMGLPIARITLATNSNPTLSEFFAGGAYRGRPSMSTLANAMDVGAPSNFERLLHFQSEAQLRSSIECIQIDDQHIRQSIAKAHTQWDYVCCPHTACALAARNQLTRQSDSPQWIVATAHPAKFPEVVEPVVGETVALPDQLARWLANPSSAKPMENDYAALRDDLAQLRA